MTSLRSVSALGSILLALCGGAFARAVEPAVPPISPESRVQAMIDRGLGYLKTQQGPEGAWPAPRGAVAITALSLKAFAQNEPTRNADFVRKGYDALLANQLESGGIYKDSLASYNTAIAISALAKADRPDFKARIDKAVAYLRSLQWSESIDGLPSGDKIGPNDPRIGGWGYGSKGRPDGSNTQFALAALRDAGISGSDPAFKAAAEFMSRSQNLASNSQPWASNDGGFIYSPARGGESFAGEFTDSDGVKRFHSYGSMTYAGIKSLLYAGISREDPRVVAAWRWLSGNWTLTENPGMRNAGPDHAADGMFYYYHILARTLHEYGEPSVPSRAGSVDWRLELIAELEKRQLPSGAWKGGKAYMEENEVLVTAYAVLALQEIQADLKARPIPAATQP
jgi:squalene-hopene/tetraprenyl-beta-curcumene cyclase